MPKREPNSGKSAKQELKTKRARRRLIYIDDFCSFFDKKGPRLASQPANQLLAQHAPDDDGLIVDGSRSWDFLEQPRSTRSAVALEARQAILASRRDQSCFTTAVVHEYTYLCVAIFQTGRGSCCVSSKRGISLALDAKSSEHFGSTRRA